MAGKNGRDSIHQSWKQKYNAFSFSLDNRGGLRELKYRKKP